MIAVGRKVKIVYYNPPKEVYGVIKEICVKEGPAWPAAYCIDVGVCWHEPELACEFEDGAVCEVLPV